MDRFIACCGLDCERCEARIATVNDDDVLRRRVAEEWSRLNGVEITPEMINCVGCRIEGAKTPYCESLCPVRLCVEEKGYETCGDCPDLRGCAKVAAIIAGNPQTLRNLGRDSL